MTGDRDDRDDRNRDGTARSDHPTELGHVHLKVRDVDRAVEFYTGVLGLEVEERHDRFAFLTYGDHHHDVALQEVRADASGPGQRGGVGLYHSAFEVPDESALVATYRRLRERDVSVSPVDHGISRALYFDDPSGNGCEVYLDTRAERDRQQWRGLNEPFDPLDLA